MDNSLTININGNTYPLATNLRVAYIVQGQHNHAPYSKVFAEIGEMPVEDQIGLIYASFSAANPHMTQDMTRQVFLEYYLDHFNLQELMDSAMDIISAITGVPRDAMDVEPQDAPDGGDQGNE